MKKKLPLQILLSIDSFIKQPITYNGITLDCVADFYEFNLDDKSFLFEMNDKFSKITSDFKNKIITFDQYAQNINSLSHQVKNKENISISMDHNNNINLTLKATLQITYQTDKQILQSVKKDKQSVNKHNGLIALYSFSWTESEAGWGQRPDGFTFHRSYDDALAFVKKQNDINKQQNQVPDCYNFTNSDKPILLEVSQELFNYVMENGDTWLSKNNAADYKTYKFNENKPKLK